MGSLEPLSILDTPEGEIALLSALIQARPVGLQKHWAMLSILRTLEARLGEGRVTSEEAWGKLRSLYDLRLLDADAADLQAAEEAEAEVAAEGIGFFTFNTATTAARRRSRRSSLHERPHIERPEFNLVQRPSFQEEFEKRRRRSSPSPGANDDGHEPAGTKEMARSPSELSMLDDKDIVMPTNALEQKEEETLQVHLDDGEEEHKDSNNELVENAASPSRSARFTRSKQGTASERKHGYRKTRKLSPDKRIKGERSDEDLKLLKRQVDEEEEASSDAASTLSALSDGEEGGISNERYQHPDRMGSALGDIDIGEENEVTDEEGGADRLSNLDEDTETDRGSGPEDSPYKSPKIKKNNSKLRNSANTTNISKKSSVKGGTGGSSKSIPSLTNKDTSGIGKSSDKAGLRKTRSSSPDKDDSESLAAASKRLSGAAAASVRRRIEKEKRGDPRRK